MSSSSEKKRERERGQERERERTCCETDAVGRSKRQRGELPPDPPMNISVGLDTGGPLRHAEVISKGSERRGLRLFGS